MVPEWSVTTVAGRRLFMAGLVLSMLTGGTTPMDDVTKKKGDVAEVARVMNWRKQNPEKYRTYQRELMRKRREKNRVSVPADPES